MLVPLRVTLSLLLVSYRLEGRVFSYFPLSPPINRKERKGFSDVFSFV